MFYLNLLSISLTSVDTLAALGDTWVVASLSSIVPPQVVLTAWSLGAHLILTDTGNTDMEDVTEVRVSDLSTIWSTLTIVVAVWDTNLIV